MQSTDLRLIQTLRSFDYPIEPNPGNVHYTGPCLDEPDWVSQGQSPGQDPVQSPVHDPGQSPGQDPVQSPGQDSGPGSERARDPLVVISFSSTFQNQKEVIQRSVEALQGWPVRGLVTLGTAMESESFDIPENVTVTASAPHDLVFPHADLVITHAGHGTIMRAFRHGLPLVCLPMGRDQNDNAAKVNYHGCGIRLSRKSGAPEIRRAVETILADPAFRLNVSGFRNELEQISEMDLAIQLLEELDEKRADSLLKSSGSGHKDPVNVHYSEELSYDK